MSRLQELKVGHETFVRHEVVERGSDRTFGLVFSAMFSLVALLPLLAGGKIRLWALIAGGIFLLVSITRPTLLSGLNRLWMSFGLFLHRIFSQVILALLFYVILTPYSIVLRAFRKGELPLSFEPDSDSYWIDRSKGEATSRMTNQY